MFVLIQIYLSCNFLLPTFSHPILSLQKRSLQQLKIQTLQRRPFVGTWSYNQQILILKANGHYEWLYQNFEYQTMHDKGKVENPQGQVQNKMKGQSTSNQEYKQKGYWWIEDLEYTHTHLNHKVRADHQLCLTQSLQVYCYLIEKTNSYRSSLGTSRFISQPFQKNFSLIIDKQSLTFQKLSINPP